MHGVGAVDRGRRGWRHLEGRSTDTFSRLTRGGSRGEDAEARWSVARRGRLCDTITGFLLHATLTKY